MHTAFMVGGCAHNEKRPEKRNTTRSKKVLAGTDWV